MDKEITIDWEKNSALTSQLDNYYKGHESFDFVYELNELIGNQFLVLDRKKGGMSHVYFCFDLDLHELGTKVLKTLNVFKLFDDEDQRKLKNEANIWTELGHHPNIVKCHYLHTIIQRPLLELEWVASKDHHPVDLSNWLYSFNPNLNRILTIAYGIVSGMVYANKVSEGIVHRDLKPSNILIDQDLNPKITDFGIANLLSSLDKSDFKTGVNISAKVNNSYSTVIGTPLYMAPELWEGNSGDQRSDIYSFGCVLYEMLAKRLLFTGVMDDLKQKHLFAEVPELDKGLPEIIKMLTYKCLRKDPSMRFQTFIELENALFNILNFTKSDIKVPRVEYNAFYYGNRAITYVNTGDYEKAKHYFDLAFELDPYLTRAYNNRGIMYYKLEEYDKALEDYSRAIELDNKFGEAYNNRGTLYLQLEQFDLALADFNKAISLDEDIIGVWRHRAFAYLKLGEYSRGMEDCERAIASAEKMNFDDYFVKAELLFGLKKYQEAIDLLEWIEQNSSDETIITRIIHYKIKPLSKIDLDNAISIGKFYASAMAEVFKTAYPYKMVGDIFFEAESYKGALVFYYWAMEEGLEDAEESIMKCLSKIAGFQNQNQSNNEDS